ncbi:MAG: 30S ribosomal protein S19 [Planctomycetota bacterium]
MSRSLKKGPFIDPKLLRKVLVQKNTNRMQPIKTWARACTISPEFVGHAFDVHNGKKFVRVQVTEEMVGHKLGEFSHTRLFKAHGGVKKADEGAPSAG